MHLGKRQAPFSVVNCCVVMRVDAWDAKFSDVWNMGRKARKVSGCLGGLNTKRHDDPTRNQASDVVPPNLLQTHIPWRPRGHELARDPWCRRLEAARLNRPKLEAKKLTHAHPRAKKVNARTSHFEPMRAMMPDEGFEPTTSLV